MLPRQIAALAEVNRLWELRVKAAKAYADAVGAAERDAKSEAESRAMGVPAAEIEEERVKRREKAWKDAQESAKKMRDDAERAAEALANAGIAAAGAFARARQAGIGQGEDILAGIAKGERADFATAMTVPGFDASKFAAEAAVYAEHDAIALESHEYIASLDLAAVERNKRQAQEIADFLRRTEEETLEFKIGKFAEEVLAYGTSREFIVGAGAQVASILVSGIGMQGKAFKEMVGTQLIALGIQWGLQGAAATILGNPQGPALIGIGIAATAAGAALEGNLPGAASRSMSAGGRARLEDMKDFTGQGARNRFADAAAANGDGGSVTYNTYYLNGSLWNERLVHADIARANRRPLSGVRRGVERDGAF